MALSFFSGAGSASNAKYFDIRLNDDYIVFRGDEHGAASAHLKGTLVLCLSEPLTIKHIRLQLTGMSRVCWHLPSSSTAGGRKSWRERVFYDKTWRFRDPGKGKTEILPAGNYEYPFDVVLEGSMPESVEGLSETWVMYRFKAEIGRKYAKDIVARKPLRIIRTLDPSALELSHAMSVDNIWPNKIEYSISTPTKAVIFGTSIRVDFKLIPLLKGLRIGQITSQLIESHDLTLNPEDPDSIRNTYKITRTILTDEHELPEDDVEIIDEAAEGYQSTRYLDMPQTLARCLQDTDTKGIKIRHKLKFRIQLHNPDGHISELRATLPVSIFISPNIPIDDNNNLLSQTPVATRRAADDFANQAPPLYTEHQFDQLYSEVDPNGYRTPGPGSGGPGTPFGALSRNISAENLASMNALTNTDISASALHSRLTNLSANRFGQPSPSDPHHDSPTESHPNSRQLNVHFDYFGPSSGSNSHSPASPELSRRASDEVEHEPIPSGMATPFHPQYAEVETLSRVPSYSTAVRAAVGPCDSNLPDYNAVMASSLPTPPVLQSPQQAYLRSGRSSGFSTPLEVNRPGQFHSSGNNADDVERRLRLAQARARA
ncbi:HECT-type ubiquitin ligase-interacting protein creD [Penicillium macrosclerotiorum]|uniref:HECT-type ubiquitin ligase-interacting protein creD n=1 Tax=Penicillium macrosclerotiorum TaxID=303699 RepID=UPI0025472D8E|nr:HECT-type ubiquitin ligase-interacting protein creD [Penicillium macrosclerotiorum]KAJ5669594.1 HECT-type ubiquitin ligase-interacting protein creD [Penicillium macrosclerotiorum]